MVITARVGLFLWLLGITTAAAVPITCAVYLARPAGPPEPCAESAELRSGADGRYSCPPAARLEAWPAAAGYVLVKCLCTPRGAGADAGAR